jgi:abhydrolase domain-containing protein 17
MLPEWLSFLLRLCLFAWLALALFALLFARSMLFQPPKPGYKPDFVQMIESSQGQKIAIRYYANPKASYTVLLSHGNAEDIASVDSLCQWLYAQGLSVLSYDYRGYGLSQGHASEQNSYEDVTAAYTWLQKVKGIPAKRIIAFGFSLGASLAVDLASRMPVAAVVLQSPFVSAYRVMTRFTLLPWDQFDNLSKIQKIDSAILIIHGDQDEVVPFWHGKRLHEKAKQPKSFLWVKGARHNDLQAVAGQSYGKAWLTFLAKLP